MTAVAGPCHHDTPVKTAPSRHNRQPRLNDKLSSTSASPGRSGCGTTSQREREGLRIPLREQPA